MCDKWRNSPTATRFPLRYDPPGGVPALHPPEACASKRNVYIDLGANWCNTLKLFGRLPGKVDKAAPWQVYAFEAHPLISPFVESCCAALSRGELLPTAPVPPAGHSSGLLRYGNHVGCHHRTRGFQLDCIIRALNVSLHALQVDPALSSNTPLISARLQAARAMGCKSGTLSSFTMIPAAAAATNGCMWLNSTTRSALVRGVGTDATGRGESFSVATVDVVGWLRRSFTEQDHVVLKMDIEGAENELVPALLASNTSRLVDVLLWECHLKIRGGWSGRCQCEAWEAALRASGVQKIYHDPYPFASGDDVPPYRFPEPAVVAAFVEPRREHLSAECSAPVLDGESVEGGWHRLRRDGIV